MTDRYLAGLLWVIYGGKTEELTRYLKKAIAVITDFRKAKKQDDEFFMTIQKGVIDLETACLDRKLA